LDSGPLKTLKKLEAAPVRLGSQRAASTHSYDGALALLITLLICLSASLSRADQPTDPYRIISLDYPPDVTLEASGLARLPGGKLAVAIRRGEVWVAENPYAPEGKGVRWKRFASGLHEPLGLAFHDGALYTTQRSEVTRLRDTNGDGTADEYTCAAKGWGVSGAYHEYAYGPKFDSAGNMWVTLNCTMGDSFVPQKDWRGFSLRITPDGAWKPVSGGMRSPSGIGINAAGDVFYSEQQGNWNCGGGVHHIRQGAFHGHQASFASAGLPGAPFAKPAKPVERVPIPEAERLMPIYKPPAVWLPYRKVGMSATDLVLDNTGGKFGPFDGQFFVGEFTMSAINRVFLEKVDGEYQGACFNFMDGFQCGVLRMEFGDDGSLFVGETNRGWNSFGTRSYGLQRVLWNGKPPFDMQKMEALPHGFRCTFTKPITRAAAAAAQWQMRSYTYEYHAEYGGPDIDVQTPGVRLVNLSADGLAAELAVDGLRAGYIHELDITGLAAADGDPLAHPAAHYTLNKIPAP
jgi:glucose/arabinose dehydrogenase